ncbi:MAG: hypothetical protein AB7H85_02200 [Dehalococcoidia bacterium]
MTSFGRTVDLDRFVSGPASALAQRVVDEHPSLVAVIDRALYEGASMYHLRLLAGAWVMTAEGNVPRATAEVFEEAVAWRFGPLARSGAKLPHRLSELARGEFERIGIEEELDHP